VEGLLYGSHANQPGCGVVLATNACGTVPVEPDGSAYFDVPAMRSVFFVALDENDMAVKRMQSFTSVLAMIVAGKEFLERESTRFDMPQFRPRADWVREMKRYGVLPDGVKPEEVTDVYAIEQDYWKSLWHQPVTISAAFDARNK
jgi:hypothetical protein